MWPIGYGQIQTSSQAGGMASSRIRSSTLGSVTRLAVVVEVLEALAAPAAANAGPGAVDSLESGHGGALQCPLCGRVNLGGAVLRALTAAVKGSFSGERPVQWHRMGGPRQDGRLPQCSGVLAGEGGPQALEELRSRAASTGERISSEARRPPGRATAPPASVTSSWAAAASTERIGRRRQHRVELAGRHQAERHRHRAERADAARAHGLDGGGGRGHQLRASRLQPEHLERARAGAAAGARRRGTRPPPSPPTSRAHGAARRRRTGAGRAPPPSRSRRRPCGDRRRSRSRRTRTAGPAWH